MSSIINFIKMVLTKEEWKKSYEHRFDNRKNSYTIDIWGNKRKGKNHKRRTKLKTPEWLLKGGSLPKDIQHDTKTDTYTRIRKGYIKRGYKTKQKRMAAAKRASSCGIATINDSC